MGLLNTIGEYARLARIHSAVLTGLTPFFGALAVDPNISWFTLLLIFIMGLFVHVFGFVLNEYFDLEIDRKSKDLSTKPLVSGKITPGSALAFCWGAVAISYLLLFVLIFDDFNLWPLIFLTLTFITFYAYDKYGKTILGADLLLAGYVGLLCLAGASIIRWFPNELAILVAFLAFFQLFLQNAIAGLKDVDHDRISGARTSAIRLGVRVQTRKELILISSRFKIYIYGVKIIHLAVIFCYFYLYDELFGIQFTLILLVSVLMFGLLYKILSMRKFERERLIRLIGAHELVTYAIIPLLFIDLIGWLTIFMLLIFPIVWLAAFMILMYGKLLPQI